MRQAAFAVLAILAFGCNAGQPIYMRVAIDRAPEKTISDASCFRDSNVPSGFSDVKTNYREEHFWVLWSSAENRKFLDIGTPKFKLGHSPDIVVEDVIEGGIGDDGKNIFTGTRRVDQPYTPGANNGTETKITTVAVKFDDLSATPTGTIALTSSYTCSNDCPKPNTKDDRVSCKSSLNFVGRQVALNQVVDYGPAGK